jgi:hypothetical protein
LSKISAWPSSPLGKLKPYQRCHLWEIDKKKKPSIVLSRVELLTSLLTTKGKSLKHYWNETCHRLSYSYWYTFSIGVSTSLHYLKNAFYELSRAQALQPSKDGIDSLSLVWLHNYFGRNQHLLSYITQFTSEWIDMVSLVQSHIFLRMV